MFFAKNDEEYRNELIELFENNPKGISRTILKPKYSELYSWILKKTDFLDKQFNSTIKFKSRYFCIKNKLSDFPKCIECGSKIICDFKNNKTIKQFCSKSCAVKNNKTQEKIRQTKLIKYGNETFVNIDKAKETKKKLYGNENFVNVDKAKETKKNRYNDENYNNREKARKTIQKLLENDSLYFEKKNLKKQQTSNEIYGVTHPSKSSIVKEKRYSTCLKKYGVENFVESDIFKIKSKMTNENKTDFEKEKIIEKIKETKHLKYGDESFNNRLKMKLTKKERHNDENFVNSDKAKETCLNKYGVSSFAKTNEFKEKFKDKNFVEMVNKKRYLTHKKNKTFTISKKEEQVYSLLKEVFPNIIRQYRSEKYPFNCDFYIPSEDIYIEFNGTWTHGKHPFDINNKNDIDFLNLWKEKSCFSKFYQNAIETWTKRDVLKRETAKNNNVNFIEFWNLDEVKKWINSIILL